MVVEETSSTRAYFGALAFIKLLEKLVFRTVPLQVLLDWLSKPKGLHLMEASGAATPKKALAIAVTRQMLYGEEAPLVGVRLVYKLHYISTEPFSAAYMHLHVWHMAGSQVESVDKLTSSRLLFVSLSEMSSVLPVVVQHPVLLDMATREMLTKTDEPLAPLHFRGFRFHTVWTQQPGEDLVRQVVFPHFLGKTTSSMLEYEPERIPQELTQGQKMAVNLRPPSSDHWNIVSDLICPLILDTFQQRREAKRVAIHQEEGSEGAEASPMETSAPGKSPQVEAEGSGEALPGGVVLPRQRVIETAQEILVCVHALRLQTMHDMGSMRELDRTLACALMAEFARLQLTVGQDLTRSLIALQRNMETSVDCRSQRPSSHGTMSPLIQSWTKPTRVQRPHPQSSAEDAV